MPRYFDELPTELRCLVCHLTLPVTAFRRLFYKNGTSDGRGPHTVYDGCYTCQGLYKQRKLTPAQLRRWLALAQEARQNDQQRKRKPKDRSEQSRAERFRETYDAKVDTMSPYDQAVAELEAAWGKPVAQWTLADDRACTVRMYEILGWPVDKMPDDRRLKQIDNKRYKRAQRAREREGRAELEAWAASTTDDDESLAYA